MVGNRKRGDVRKDESRPIGSRAGISKAVAFQQETLGASPIVRAADGSPALVGPCGLIRIRVLRWDEL